MKKNRGMRKRRKNCRAADQRICMPNDFRATWFITTRIIVNPRRASSQPRRGVLLAALCFAASLFEEFELSDMWRKFI